MGERGREVEEKVGGVGVRGEGSGECLPPVHPLHFYIVKLGFTGVYIIFLISAQKHRLWVLIRTASTQKHRLWYSLEPPRRGGSSEYPQSMF